MKKTAAALLIKREAPGTTLIMSLRRWNEIQEYGLQKKLYELNRNKDSKRVVIYQTRRGQRKASVMQSNKWYVRQILFDKLRCAIIWPVKSLIVIGLETVNNAPGPEKMNWKGILKNHKLLFFHPNLTC